MLIVVLIVSVPLGYLRRMIQAREHRKAVAAEHPFLRCQTSRERRTFERIESLSVDRRSSLAKFPTVCKRICESPMSARDVRKGALKVGIEMVFENMFQDAARDPAADVAILQGAPFQHGWPNLVGMAFCMLPQHQQSLPADVRRPIVNHLIAHPKNELAISAHAKSSPQVIHAEPTISEIAAKVEPEQRPLLRAIEPDVHQIAR